MSDSSDANSLNTQILQLKEENRQLRQRVSYVSPHKKITKQQKLTNNNPNDNDESNFSLGLSDHLAGSRSEYSVAEVRLQQGGLHPRPVPEAEGEPRAGPDAGFGLGELRAAPPGDLPAQHPAGGQDQRV